MRVSRHAAQRGEERLNLNDAAFERLAQKAFSLGLTHMETTGCLKSYLTRLGFNNPTVTNFRVYGEHVYLFNNEPTLVTVLMIPSDLKRAAIKQMNRKRELLDAS